MLPDLGEAAEEILGPVLSQKGFDLEAYSSTSITYRDETRVVELSHYPEDPQRWLNVVLGLVQPGGLLRAALWRLYSETEAPPLRFDSTESLRQQLVLVRDEWLDRLIWPAFEDSKRFRRAALTEFEELQENYARSRREERLVQARRAFDRQDWWQAAETYAGILDLSAADTRRYAVARRRTTPEL